MTGKPKKVRCLVCNEILTYENDDTSALVDHLNLEHSGVDVFRFLGHCQVTGPRPRRDTDREHCSMEAGDTSSEVGIKAKSYKETVDSWMPGPNCITCPKCAKEAQPIVKKQKTKVAKSPLSAICMLGCWPFCFLPFLFRKDQCLDLFCSSCKCYLGTYDKKKRVMISSPNKSSDTSACAREHKVKIAVEAMSGKSLLSKDMPPVWIAARETSKIVGIPPPLYDPSGSENANHIKPDSCECKGSPAPSYGQISTKNVATVSQDFPQLLPSYSSIMKKEPKSESFNPPRPPPTYNDVPGVYMIPSSRHIDHVYALPSLREPIWRSHSQPAHCPRCDVLVLTMTRTSESLATHAAALALCIFGCWPCCLLPYCLNVCKNTYHLCPICKGYLGAYSPW